MVTPAETPNHPVTTVWKVPKRRVASDTLFLWYRNGTAREVMQ